MIQQNSKLRVSDNSGAKIVKCIKVLGGFKKTYARLGDVIVVSVQELRNRSKKTSKVRKKEIYKALIIRTKTKSKKKSGFSSMFFENVVVLMNKQENPIGTRIIGPVAKKLKTQKLKRFTNIAAGFA